MDCGAFSPEVNAGRMYTSPGCASMLAAPAAWDGAARRKPDRGQLLASDDRTGTTKTRPPHIATTGSARH